MGLDELKEKIQKNVKGSSVDVLSQSSIASIEEYVPTPHYDLNRVLSGDLFKGLPEKTLSLLVGSEASFKSSFMALTMVNAQKQGYTPVVIDTEGAWTGEFVTNWGLDPDNILYVYSPFVGEVMSVLGQILDEGDKYFIALDSIGNLEAEKLKDDLKGKEHAAKADQGRLQKDIKRMLKLLLAIAKKQKSIAVCSGHYYGNPSMYGSAEQIGGGYHMRLSPHIILSLKKSKIMDAQKNVIGNSIKAITLKNRFHPAFQECEVNIDYQQGVDRYSGIDEIAQSIGVIEKKGSWFVNTKTGNKVQGSSKLAEIIDDETLNQINEYVQKTGYSTVNKQLEDTLGEAEELINAQESMETEEVSAGNTPKSKKYKEKK